MGYYEAKIEGLLVPFHSGTNDRWRYVFDGGGVDQRTEPSKPWYGR